MGTWVDEKIFNRINKERQLEEERTLAILNEVLIEDDVCAKDFNAEYERIK